MTNQEWDFVDFIAREGGTNLEMDKALSLAAKDIAARRAADVPSPSGLEGLRRAHEAFKEAPVGSAREQEALEDRENEIYALLAAAPADVALPVPASLPVALAELENDRLGKRVFETIAPHGRGWAITLRESGVDGTWYYAPSYDEALSDAKGALLVGGRG